MDIDEDIEIIKNTNNNDIGLYINRNENIYGYIKSSNDYKSYNLKAPNTNTIFNIKEQLTEPFDLVYKLYNDIQISNIQSQISLILNQQMIITDQISQLNIKILNNIPYSKINNFPSNNNNIITGDGTISKLKNEMILDKTIDLNKLNLSNNNNLIICGDGNLRRLKDIDDFNNIKLNNYQTNGNIDINGNKIINSGDAIELTDLVNLKILNNKLLDLNNNIIDNTIDITKIKFIGDGSKVLCSDGKWRSMQSQTLIYNGNNTYEYIIGIKDINEIYNILETINESFYLIYNIKICNSVKKIKVYCKKVNNKIIQSCLTLFDQELIIDDQINTNININNYNKKLGLGYDGSLYITDNNINNLTNNNILRLSLINGLISKIYNNPIGYKLSLDNDPYYLISLIGIKINLFFNKTNYYLSNNNNIYTFNDIIKDYLLTYNYNIDKLYSITDGINNFIIYRKDNINYLSCKIDLTNNLITGELINNTLNNIMLNQQISYEQQYYIDSDIVYNNNNIYYYGIKNYNINSGTIKYIIDNMSNIIYMIIINNNGIIGIRKTNIYKL